MDDIRYHCKTHAEYRLSETIDTNCLSKQDARVIDKFSFRARNETRRPDAMVPAEISNEKFRHWFLHPASNIIGARETERTGPACTKQDRKLRKEIKGNGLARAFRRTNRARL